MPTWTFDEEIAEEKPYNYQNYQICEEQNQAPISVSHDVPREQTGRIRGRSNRHMTPKKYEVSVELHAPTSSENTQETSFVTSDYKRVAALSETHGPYVGNRFVHRQQGSGSGRSESSKADSGYEGEIDSGGFDVKRSDRGKDSKPKKFSTPGNTERVPYDNPAFEEDGPPSGDHYAHGSDGNSHRYRTNDYSIHHQNQRSPKYSLSHDRDVSSQARQFQTIEQLDARMPFSADYKPSRSSMI